MDFWSTQSRLYITSAKTANVDGKVDQAIKFSKICYVEGEKRIPIAISTIPNEFATII